MSETVESFQKICRDTPDRRLILLPGRPAVTAAALWTLHLDIVAQLTQAGLAAGDLVVAEGRNRPETVGLFLACRAMDLAFMATDGGTSAAEVARLAGRFGAAASVRFGNPDGEHRSWQIDPGPESERRGYHGAAMLRLTSGSTGLPKATFTTECQLLEDSRHIIAAMGIRAVDTQLAIIPLSHAYGFSVIMLPLLMQGSPIVLRESFVPDQVVGDAEASGACRFPGVPYMFSRLLEHLPAATWPRALTRLISAGAPLPPQLTKQFHRQFGVKIHTFYGASEVGGISYDETDDIELVETVGRPLDGVTVTLVPEPQLPGGRVHVRSAAVANGYAVGSGDEFTDGGFLTGDLGTFSGDGRLTLLGRVSSFINVAGQKVQPDEVEAVLRSAAGIADVRVVGAKDERRGEHVVACIVLDAGHPSMTPLEVRRLCAERLAPFKIPRQVFFLEAIPLNARGKTDRDALNEIIRAHGGSQ